MITTRIGEAEAPETEKMKPLRPNIFNPYSTGSECSR